MDVEVRYEGSLWQFVPHTEDGKRALRDEVVSEPWQWLGTTLCIEWRFGRGLIDHLESLGLEVERRNGGLTMRARLEPVSGQWYTFGKVSVRFTGTKRRSLYIRLDATGEVHRVRQSTPAAWDTMEAALYYGRDPIDYAVFCFGVAHVL